METDIARLPLAAPASGLEGAAPAGTDIDSLTGLPGGAALRAMAHFGRDEGTVLLIELDEFSEVAKALGERQCDLLLRLVSQRLQGCLDEGEQLVRCGLDRFAVLSARSGEVAERLAATLVLAVNSRFVVAGEPFYLSCTIGVAARVPSGDDDVQALLMQADVALSEAKRRGRGTWLRYSAELSTWLSEKMILSQALHAAVPESDFELHYQPQIDLLSGAVVGAEALLRWQHPRRGLLMPAHFIGFAEETGRIVPIGCWVIAQAARMAAAKNRLDPGSMRIAVNVSARQLVERGLVMTVERLLRAADCEPGWLELEITESLLVRGGMALDTLLSLSSLGVSIAIDDFCTGQSSLSYLMRLPVDVLKLDRSFISGMEFDPRRAALVQAMLSMARALGLRAIAEGVESHRQAAMLRELGCDQGQGLLFSAPLQADVFGREGRPRTAFGERTRAE